MVEVDDARVKSVVNYLLRGWQPTGSQARRAWTFSVEALQATFTEGQSKQEWEKQAVKYIRKSVLAMNPQSEDHRIKLARELLT